MDRARAVLAAQERNQALQFFKYVRKYHSPAWVYRNQLLPLIEPDRPCDDVLKPAAAGTRTAAGNGKKAGARRSAKPRKAAKQG